MNSIVSRHALAAGIMLRERELWCRREVEEPAIRAGRSMEQASNLQIEGPSRHRADAAILQPRSEHSRHRKLEVSVQVGNLVIRERRIGSIFSSY